MMLNEWNQHHGFQFDWIAVFSTGPELPARKRTLGSLIEARVDTVQQLNAADSAISMNDGVELDYTFHVIAKRVSRIGGVILRGSYRRSDGYLVVRFLQLGKANDPASRSGSEIRHVEN